MTQCKEPYKISVIIPALNEEKAIGLVIRDIPRNLADEIIVVDNGSIDRTADVARQAGAVVIREPQRGYGSACLAGLVFADNPDIVVFLDGDYSDYPDQMGRLVAPIINDEADFVVGSRLRGSGAANVLPPQAYWGNRLAVWLIHRIFHYRYTDLGPFRAIRYISLKKLGMRDKNFGWTIEMQINAVKAGLRIKEIPVHYRDRIGTSKISGTLTGSFQAGIKILYKIGLSMCNK